MYGVELPFVSIIWINYNSRAFIDKVLSSLRALSEINYRDYELIIVDDGSTDGSDRIIKEYINAKLRNKIRETRFVKLHKNFGFTGAVNAGFSIRDKNAKFVLLHNNDAVLFPYALKNLVEFMEENKHVGAVQGIILRPNSEIVDSAGGYLILELPFYMIRPLHIRDVKLNYLKNKIRWINGLYTYVTFVEGTLPLYRVDAVKKALGKYGEKRLYITAAKFYYLEDILVSLLMWCQGYTVALLGKVIGVHHRKLTIKNIERSRRFYDIVQRNYYTLRFFIKKAPLIVNSFIDVMLLAKYLVKSVLRRIDTYKYYFEGLIFYKNICKVIDRKKIRLDRIPLLVKIIF